MDFKCDWFRVVTDLERAGMKQSHQAKEVGVSQVTIYYWKVGHSEPLFSSGMRLIDLYKSVIGSTEDLIK